MDLLNSFVDNWNTKLTAIRGQLRDTLFNSDIDYLADIQRVIQKAKSIFTFADQG